MDRSNREFIARYHRALTLSQKEDIDKTNAKMGSILADDWVKAQGKLPITLEEFVESYNRYLEESFRFAEAARVRVTDNKGIELAVKGCHLCFGNELLRKENQKTACPIIRMTANAILRSTGKRVTLKEVKKPGPIGECYIEYEIG